LAGEGSDPTRGDDFELVARLESVVAIGEAGLIARSDVRDPSSSLIRVAVEVEPRVMLFSQLRSSDGEPAAAVGSPPVPVTLPLWLRVRRIGSVLSTAYSTNGAIWTTHASYDAGVGELALEQLSVGPFQTSRDDLATAVATFGDTAFGSVALPPDAGCIDDILLPRAAARRWNRGHRVRGVSAVSVGGQSAVVVAATPTLLVFDTLALPPTASPLASGRVVLEGDFESQEFATPIAFSGVPFLRGDCDGDLDVDASDLAVLQETLGRGGRELHCAAAADLDGDLRVTWVDHAARRLARERLVARWPAAPTPGIRATGTPVRTRRIRASPACSTPRAHRSLRARSSERTTSCGSPAPSCRRFPSAASSTSATYARRCWKAPPRASCTSASTVCPRRA
jgi:hypothetical protein